MNQEKIEACDCPIDAFMSVLGGKYKALIVYQLVGRTLRYSEIARLIPKASPRMLSRQLKDLEEDGIINRKLYPVVPPKTEYSLTELGETLVPLIQAMCDWGFAYFEAANIPARCEGVNPYMETWNRTA